MYNRRPGYPVCFWTLCPPPPSSLPSFDVAMSDAVISGLFARQGGTKKDPSIAVQMQQQTRWGGGEAMIKETRILRGRPCLPRFLN